MSLKSIVAAQGGELHAGGCRAHIPAPGHSRMDRSVSLMLDGDRVVIHGFGAAGWREVRDHLKDLGLIDAAGRLTGAGVAGSLARGSGVARPSACVRIARAGALWEAAHALEPGDLCHRHFRSRRIHGPVASAALRRLTQTPVSLFRESSRTCSSLIAAVSTPEGGLGAVEIAYLDPDGRAARRLRLPRKTVGVVPPGSAVRLSPAAGALLVAEGVITTLSAMARFDLPGWALLSAGNLAAWSAPSEARRILIAADRGRAGEAAASRLRARLVAEGLDVVVRLPPSGFGDWNEAAP